MGGDLSGLVQHDLYERGVSNVAKVNDQFGDTIERMAGIFWILGEADHLFTLAWLSACVEIGVHWLSPAAQGVSDTLKEIWPLRRHLQKRKTHSRSAPRQRLQNLLPQEGVTTTI